MRPRTKHQIEVFDNSKHLTYINNKMLEWAKVTCLDHKGYATKSRVICMDCGEKFSPDLVKRKRATCPHCGQKLVIEESRKSTLNQKTYVAIAEMYYHFQVIRNFEICSYHKSGRKTRYYVCEILQHWINSNGKREVVSRNHNTSWYCDSWNGNLEIRDKGTRKYWESNQRYDVYPQKYHPDSEFKPEYVKMGINSKLQELTFIEAIGIIPDNPHAETLLKAGQYELLSMFRYNSGAQIKKYWSSVKIVMRNRYKVTDAKIWIDYLDMLQYSKKDLHNAHYVCPNDLKKQHDVYVKRKRQAMDVAQMKRDYISILRYFGEEIGKNFVYPKNLKRKYQILVEKHKIDKLEKRKIELSELDFKYKEFIKQFIDLEFVDKNIKIIPLANIDEFKVEAATLHHCVYSNEYFKREDCLILSARMEDQRLATIEINLNSMKIIQCRGDHNKVPEHYDRIQSLVNRNIKQIKKRFLLSQIA